MELPQLSAVVVARRVLDTWFLWGPYGIPMELPQLSAVVVARKVVAPGSLWGPYGVPMGKRVFPRKSLGDHREPQEIQGNP